MYEETSLGIYEAEETAYGLDDSPDSRVEIWGRYLWKHARRQLSFDMWWLVLSLFLICIIEVRVQRVISRNVFGEAHGAYER